MTNQQQEKVMNKREFLFLYDAKDCIPNGDPFTGEQRYDEDTQTVYVFYIPFIDLALEIYK